MQAIIEYFNCTNSKGMPVELVNVMTSCRLELRFLTLLKWQKNTQMTRFRGRKAQPLDFKETFITDAGVQYTK